LTKLHNDELPSVKAGDLLNYVVLASTRTNVCIVEFNYWPRVNTGHCGKYKIQKNLQ